MGELNQSHFENDLEGLPDALEFQDHLDGSLMNVSFQEEVGEKFVCAICDASYSGKSNLKRQCKTHDDRFTFECTKCTQFFTSEEALTEHQKSKHDIKQHLCTSCGKTFSKTAHLHVHQRRFHEPEGLESSHKCPFEYCNKSFQQKEKFHDHMNIHTGSKPYSCGKCSKQFRGKYYTICLFE